MSKRADGPYAGRRTRSWLKAKCGHRQEFVVGGFTEPSGARRGFGALLSACTTRRARCGTPAASAAGSTTRRWRGCTRQLKKLERSSRPSPTRRGAPRRAACTGRRRGSSPRSASPSGPATASCGTRCSRDCARTRTPAEVVRESEAGAAAPSRGERRAAGAGSDRGAGPTRARARRSRLSPAPRRGAQAGKPIVGGVAISHPDRVVFPDPGLTKLDVAEYYDAVAGAHGAVPRAQRALTVIRCPDGIGSRVLLPEARDAVGPALGVQGACARRRRKGGRLPRGRHARGAAGHGPERRRGVPRLGIAGRRHRDSRRPRLRPRPGARRGVAPRA